MKDSSENKNYTPSQSIANEVETDGKTIDSSKSLPPPAYPNSENQQPSLQRKSIKAPSFTQSLQRSNGLPNQLKSKENGQESEIENIQFKEKIFSSGSSDESNEDSGVGTNNLNQTLQLQPKSSNPAHTGQLQAKSNNTGLPDKLKSGIENLSGMSMDDVKVNFNSDKPAQLNAHAYAQGNNIEVSPGQEKHLPHEAWHVVQQKQGRVQPTAQLKGKVNINEDQGLEKETDQMGEKAMQLKSANAESPPSEKPNNSNNSTTFQLQEGPPEYYEDNGDLAGYQKNSLVDNPNPNNVSYDYLLEDSDQLEKSIIQVIELGNNYVNNYSKDNSENEENSVFNAIREYNKKHLKSNLNFISKFEPEFSSLKNIKNVSKGDFDFDNDFIDYFKSELKEMLLSTLKEERKIETEEIGKIEINESPNSYQESVIKILQLGKTYISNLKDPLFEKNRERKVLKAHLDNIHKISLDSPSLENIPKLSDYSNSFDNELVDFFEANESKLKGFLATSLENLKYSNTKIQNQSISTLLPELVSLLNHLSTLNSFAKRPHVNKNKGQIILDPENQSTLKKWSSSLSSEERNFLKEYFEKSSNTINELEGLNFNLDERFERILKNLLLYQESFEEDSQESNSEKVEWEVENLEAYFEKKDHYKIHVDTLISKIDGMSTQAKTKFLAKICKNVKGLDEENIGNDFVKRKEAITYLQKYLQDPNDINGGEEVRGISKGVWEGVRKSAAPMARILRAFEMDAQEGATEKDNPYGLIKKYTNYKGWGKKYLSKVTVLVDQMSIEEKKQLSGDSDFKIKLKEVEAKEGSRYAEYLRLIKSLLNIDVNESKKEPSVHTGKSRMMTDYQEISLEDLKSQVPKPVEDGQEANNKARLIEQQNITFEDLKSQVPTHVEDDQEISTLKFSEDDLREVLFSLEKVSNIAMNFFRRGFRERGGFDDIIIREIPFHLERILTNKYASEYLNTLEEFKFSKINSTDEKEIKKQKILDIKSHLLLEQDKIRLAREDLENRTEKSMRSAWGKNRGGIHDDVIRKQLNFEEETHSYSSKEHKNQKRNSFTQFKKLAEEISFNRVELSNDKIFNNTYKQDIKSKFSNKFQKHYLLSLLDSDYDSQLGEPTLLSKTITLAGLIGDFAPISDLEAVINLFINSSQDQLKEFILFPEIWLKIKEKLAKNTLKGKTKYRGTGLEFIDKLIERKISKQELHNVSIIEETINTNVIDHSNDEEENEERLEQPIDNKTKLEKLNSFKLPTKEQPLDKRAKLEKLNSFKLPTKEQPLDKRAKLEKLNSFNSVGKEKQDIEQRIEKRNENKTKLEKLNSFNSVGKEKQDIEQKRIENLSKTPEFWGAKICVEAMRIVGHNFHRSKNIIISYIDQAYNTAIENGENPKIFLGNIWNYINKNDYVAKVFKGKAIDYFGTDKNWFILAAKKLQEGIPFKASERLDAASFSESSFKQVKGFGTRPEDVLRGINDAKGIRLLEEWTDYPEEKKKLKLKLKTAKNEEEKEKIIRNQFITYLPDVRFNIKRRLKAELPLGDYFNVYKKLLTRIATALNEDTEFTTILQNSGADYTHIRASMVHSIGELTEEQVVNTGWQMRYFSTKYAARQESARTLGGRQIGMYKHLSESPESEGRAEYLNEHQNDIAEATDEYAARKEIFTNLKDKATDAIMLATSIIIGIITTVATLGAAAPLAAATSSVIIAQLIVSMGFTAVAGGAKMAIARALKGAAFNDAEGYFEIVKSVLLAGVTVAAGEASGAMMDAINQATNWDGSLTESLTEMISTLQNTNTGLPSEVGKAGLIQTLSNVKNAEMNSVGYAFLEKLIAVSPVEVGFRTLLEAAVRNPTNVSRADNFKFDLNTALDFTKGFLQDAFLKGMFDITSGDVDGIHAVQDHTTDATDGYLPTFISGTGINPLNGQEVMRVIVGENILWSQNYSVAEQDSGVYFMDKYIMEKVPGFREKFGMKDDDDSEFDHKENAEQKIKDKEEREEIRFNEAVIADKYGLQIEDVKDPFKYWDISIQKKYLEMIINEQEIFSKGNSSSIINEILSTINESRQQELVSFTFENTKFQKVSSALRTRYFS